MCSCITRTNVTFIPESSHHCEGGCVFHSSSGNISVAPAHWVCCAGHFDSRLLEPSKVSIIMLITVEKIEVQRG